MKKHILPRNAVWTHIIISLTPFFIYCSVMFLKSTFLSTQKFCKNALCRHVLVSLIYAKPVPQGNHFSLAVHSAGSPSIPPVEALHASDSKSENNLRKKVKLRFITSIGNYWGAMTINTPLYPQSSSMLWNYSKCGVYTVESEAGC
jgi:hypothetical protein